MNYGLKIEETTDWTNYLPTYEPQILKDGNDEQGCWIWGTLNLLEILLKKEDNKEFNLSERFVFNGLLSDGTGGDPTQACEFISKYGVIDNEDLPTPETLKEFMTPRPLTKDLLKKAKKFPYKISYNKSVLQDYIQQQFIKDKLKLSPVGVTLFAWKQDNNGLYYRPEGANYNNHYCVIFKETDDFYSVLDTYDQSIKNVRKDMVFGLMITMSITKKTCLEKLISI